MSSVNIQKGSFVKRLGNIEEDAPLPVCAITVPVPVPDTPFEPMEFLSRSWSSSSIEVIQAVSPNTQDKSRAMITRPLTVTPPSSPQHSSNDEDFRIPTDKAPLIPKDFQFDFDKFTFQPEENSSWQWKSNNLKNWSWVQQTMHADFHPGQQLQKKLVRLCIKCTSHQFSKSKPDLKTLIQSASIKKWLKEVKEKKKEVSRLQNAEMHAAVSVAGLAAALAAIAAARVEESSQPHNKKTEAAVASAAALVAAQCAEVAQNMGADRTRISSAINSAISVKNAGDILTLTAAAATSLRGAATLKSRPKKEWLQWNHSSIIPYERDGASTPTSSISEDITCDEMEASFVHNRTLLAKGSDLVIHAPNRKSTVRSVSVFLNIQTQVILKIRGSNISRAFVKPKESIILEIQAWPDGNIVHEGDRLLSLTLNTSDGMVALEFKDYAEHQVWMFTISRMLSMANHMKEK